MRKHLFLHSRKQGNVDGSGDYQDNFLKISGRSNQNTPKR